MFLDDDISNEQLKYCEVWKVMMTKASTISLDNLPILSTTEHISLKRKYADYVILLLFEETNSKFNQILYKNIFEIFYKDNNMQFLFDLE